MRATEAQKLDLNTKHVSFRLLTILFNDTFGLKESVDDYMIPQQISKLLSDIAKVILDNQKNNFDPKQHFSYPQSSLEQFITDLKREPFNSGKDHTQDIFEALGNKYRAGEHRVNTQMFILDVEGLVDRQRDKNSLFNEIRKQI
jgi:hypothetical protein